MKNEIADPEQSDNNAYQIISACAIPSTVLAAERVIPSIIKIPIVSRRDQSDIIQVFYSVDNIFYCLFHHARIVVYISQNRFVASVEFNLCILHSSISQI